ncbi:MAG: glycosyltransferase family 4 protein, partial [Phycisphaerales bacterium]|nr:glycosyltransferase family 4 protein [Phycisphaerales bacterium]
VPGALMGSTSVSTVPLSAARSVPARTTAWRPPVAQSPRGATSSSEVFVAPAWTGRAAVRRTVRAAAYGRGAVALARAWKPDLVHANDHNTMWPALAIRRLVGARVLYDSHELWADRNGRPEWRPGLLAAEAVFVRAADAVITASPGYSAALAARHRIAEPPAVRNIPVDSAGPGDLVASFGDPEVVYVGGLMPGRGLEPMIRALALLPEVTLRIVGPGRVSYVAHLRQLARVHGVEERVTFDGAVPPAAVVASASGASLGLAAIEPICRSYELTLPNKLFEYVRAGVPVLSSSVPVLAGVVRDHGIGVVAASQSAVDIAAAVRAGIAPAAQAGLREAVGRFAAGNTWAMETPVLNGAYLQALAAHGRSCSP